MSKFWNWCKNLFSKAQPIVHRVEPFVEQTAIRLDPTLAPKIAIATAAYGAVKGALHEED